MQLSTRVSSLFRIEQKIATLSVHSTMELRLLILALAALFCGGKLDLIYVVQFSGCMCEEARVAITV